MLKPKKVECNDLLLDPNNPRLAWHFGDSELVPDEDIEKMQPELEKRFAVIPAREPQQATDMLIEQETDTLIGDPSDTAPNDSLPIRDLIESMRRIGFVGIQNIIVRELGDSGKYIVVEGNRRVASIKAVIREHDNALPGTKHRIGETILASLKTIEVMVLQTKGLGPDEIKKMISTTLGLRHYGSQLKWDLLPRAKNIYDEYIKLSPEPFKYTSPNGYAVAEVMAIDTAEVRKLLRGYRCYEQLGILYPVIPHHFSLILAAVENRYMKAHDYFHLDDDTFQFLGDGADKINELCEFEVRDEPNHTKTIVDPKEFKKLGTILKDSRSHESEAIRGYAGRLFAEVVDKVVNLDHAYTYLIDFKKQHRWVLTIQALLNKQENDENLHLNRFISGGQELKLRDELRELLKRYKAIMGI